MAVIMMLGLLPVATFVELHVPDFEVAKNFYQSLGFVIAWEEVAPDTRGYLVMNNGDNVITFWPGNGSVYKHKYFGQFPPTTPRGYGVEIVIMVNEIEQFYQSVKDKVEIVEDLKVRFWNVADFRVRDPFGFYLRFTEPYDVLALS